MKKVILSLMLVAFAVAVQAADQKVAQDQPKAGCCAAKAKTTAEAKTGCCPFAAKKDCKDATAKQLASPKAASLASK